MSGICLQISQSEAICENRYFQNFQKEWNIFQIGQSERRWHESPRPYLGSYQLDGGDIFHQKFLTSPTIMFHFCESDTNQWNFPHLWDSYQIVREEKFIMRKVDTRARLVKLWDQTSSLSDLPVVQNWIFNIQQSSTPLILLYQEEEAKRLVWLDMDDAWDCPYW